MITRDVLELLKCPSCHGPDLAIGSGRRPELVCTECDTHYPVLDGIPDLVPPDHLPNPGEYRTETLFNLIAGVYDVVAPVMSMAVWHCSPLRYIDVEHRALGRAEGGVLLKAPIATGVVLDHSLATYHDSTVIGIDASWKMLRRAKRRLADQNVSVQLIRAHMDNIPLKDDTVDSVQSLNGLHAESDRLATLEEFIRCARPDGYVGGTILIRGQERMADFVLDRYERYGIYPLLRTGEFLYEEMRSAGLANVHFETHGAVLFFSSNCPGR